MDGTNKRSWTEEEWGKLTKCPVSNCAWKFLKFPGEFGFGFLKCTICGATYKVTENPDDGKALVTYKVSKAPRKTIGLIDGEEITPESAILAMAELLIFSQGDGRGRGRGSYWRKTFTKIIQNYSDPVNVGELCNHCGEPLQYKQNPDSGLVDFCMHCDAHIFGETPYPRKGHPFPHFHKLPWRRERGDGTICSSQDIPEQPAH